MGDLKIEFSKICRICMKCRKITPIFGVTANLDVSVSITSSIDYSIAIKRYAAVQVSKDDGLPQNICYGCIALLNSITYFKNLCEKSYTTLQDIYRKQNTCSMSEYSKMASFGYDHIKNEEFNSKRQKSQNLNFQSNIQTSEKTPNKVESEIDAEKMFVKVENNEKNYNTDYDNSSGNEIDTTFDTSDVPVEPIKKTPKFSPNTVKSLIQSFEVKMIKTMKNREKFIQNRMRVKEFMRKRERESEKKMIVNSPRKVLSKDYIEKEKALKDMIVQVNSFKPKKGQWSPEKLQKFKSSFRLVKENACVQGPTGEKVTNMLQCLECNTIVQENSARCHYKLHLGHKYICEHCGHGFHIQKEMERHCMAKHGKKKTYACNLCSYETPYKHEFIVHERTHTGERPFACDICGRTFYKKQVLTKHVALHSNLRPHQCVYCQKGFSSKGEMKSHINSVHHRRYVYKCTECDVTYAKVTTVRKHLVALHHVPRDKQGKVPRIALT